MIIKPIEIRDEGTCIAALAIKMEAADEVEAVFLRRSGFPPDFSSVVVMRLNPMLTNYDPYGWGNGRTMQPAHSWIRENWDDIRPGQVVDVRVILGEQDAPIDPEIYKGSQP